jgi:hypothetical protein
MSVEVDIALVKKDTQQATEYFESYLYDISLVGAAVADSVASTVSVDSPDSAGGRPVDTLANELKADVNTLVVDLNNAIAQVNELLASLRASGKLDE